MKPGTTGTARKSRAALIWVALALALVVPIGAAAASPLLEWRAPVYVAAGFAGVVGLALMLVQPLLAGGTLPGLRAPLGRRIHRITGAFLVLSVILHVAGLWLTSPPDVIDALLFASPTAFTPFGVVAMWAVFAAALLAALRRRLPLPAFRRWHTLLVCLAVFGTVAHALLIEGTMEPISKVALSALVLAATAKTVFDLRAWVRRPSRPRP